MRIFKKCENENEKCEKKVKHAFGLHDTPLRVPSIAVYEFLYFMFENAIALDRPLHGPHGHQRIFNKLREENELKLERKKERKLVCLEKKKK